VNANLHLRNGRIFRFGGVQRVWSNGHDLQVYADLDESVKIGGKLTNKIEIGMDEVTRFNLKDVAEVALDEEPNPRRFQVVA